MTAALWIIAVVLLLGYLNARAEVHTLRAEAKERSGRIDDCRTTLRRYSDTLDDTIRRVEKWQRRALRAERTLRIYERLAEMTAEQIESVSAPAREDRKDG